VAMNGEDGAGRKSPSSAGSGELWRVFVRLRHRSGVYERAIRASGPLDAEHAVAIADREVLAILGSQSMGRRGAGGTGSEYRMLEAVGHRYLEVRPAEVSGSAALSPMPIVEVLRPRFGPGGSVARSGLARER
jgi:hypothetical protein